MEATEHHTNEQRTVVETTATETTSAGMKPLEVVGAMVVKQKKGEISFMWSQSLAQLELGQSYKVYIDGEFYNHYPLPTNITYTFDTIGIHTIKIT